MLFEFFSTFGAYWDWLATTYIKPYHDEILALATIVLAIFTIVLALVARRQGRDTRILQRAYISADMAGIADSTDGQLIGHVILKNVGHLPARNFCWLVKISSGDEKFTPPKIKQRALEGVSVLPIGAEWRMGSDGIDIPQGDTKPKYLFVWGRVAYNDGFRWQKRYLTFCHRYPLAKRYFPPGGGFCIDAEYGRYHDSGNDQN